MTIAGFDHLAETEKRDSLLKCCGSTHWVDMMLPVFPVEDLIDLLQYADEKWLQCMEADWLEAFSHHPKIGDVTALKEKYVTTAPWASGEQSGVETASDDVLNALAKGNQDYEQKFGFIFIVCATGKSAAEMLGLLESRLPNDPEKEIRVAAAEQGKITAIRLQKLFA